MSAARRVGLMGGTFDPIHLGHLVTAEEARVELELDEVVFVPAGTPWQKAEVTPAEQRYLMTVLATGGNPSFSVSRVEIDRPGETYTVDTLRAFRTALPEAELFFVTGADAILNILSWKDADECLALARFVAANRPGHHLTALESGPLGDRVARLDVPALAISSSDVRARFATGRSVRYLIPREVEEFARKAGLYGTSSAAVGGRVRPAPGLATIPADPAPTRRAR